MDQRSKLRLEWIAAWSGVIYIILYPVFWAGVARLQLPVPYSFTAEQVAHHYLALRDRILLGMAVSAIIGGSWLTFTAQLTVVLRRIEGEGPVFTLIQMLGGVLAG